MEQEKIDPTLKNEKLLVERLFTKEALDQFNLTTLNVAETYFDRFPEKIKHRIANNKPKMFFLTPVGKMAIAAAFILVVASTFIFLNSNVSKKSALISISIQDIPNEEIEAYVDANEWIADIDWQAEVLKSETENLKLNSDTIN